MRGKHHVLSKSFGHGLGWRILDTPMSPVLTSEAALHKSVLSSHAETAAISGEAYFVERSSISSPVPDGLSRR